MSFLAANVLVGLAWDQPRFSWAEHNISDLGNVTCGVWDTSRPRPVCSPWHAGMNAVFVGAGLLLAVGALLARRALRPGRAATVTVASAVAAGSGYVLAGLYPADVDENLHVLGALLVFALGNAALLAAALAAGRRCCASCGPSARSWACSGWPAPCCSCPGWTPASAWAAWSVSPCSRCSPG